MSRAVPGVAGAGDDDGVPGDMPTTGVTGVAGVAGVAGLSEIEPDSGVPGVIGVWLADALPEVMLTTGVIGVAGVMGVWLAKGVAGALTGILSGVKGAM